MGSYTNENRDSMHQNSTDYTEEGQLRPVEQSFCESLRRDTHWKNLILSSLTFSCVATAIWCLLTTVNSKKGFEAANNNNDDNNNNKLILKSYTSSKSSSSTSEDGYIYVPLAFFVPLYLVYIAECWHSHIRIQLQYKVSGNTVYERVRKMREALPDIWWQSYCYHYVRRTRHVTRYRNSGNAFTTTQVYYERINSHTAKSSFDYSNSGVKDATRVLTGLNAYPATKIRFTKGFSFATFEAECEFEDQRTQFFQANERRDDYMESQEGMDLLLTNLPFKDCVIAFADPDNLPWYVSHVIFWIASLLLLSWPLRVIVEYKTAYVHIHVHKLFGTNYLERGGHPDYSNHQISRVSSTISNSEMEMTISNNYAMVPSYSEALLIQSPSESSFLLRRTPQPANATNGYYVPPTSAPLRSYTFSSLSSIMESNGGGSGYGSFIQGSYSSGFLSSIHPRESPPSGPSDCITANQESGASSMLSVTVIPNVQNDELGGDSRRSSNCRMYEEDQQRRRRRWRKKPKIGNTFFASLGFGGSSSTPSSADYPDTMSNTQSSVLSPTRGSVRTLATSGQSSSPSSDYCGGVIVNPLAIASSSSFDRESTGGTPTTVEAPDAAENDDSTIYENINAAIDSQISRTSSSDFLEDQTDISSPITNNYINTASLEIDDNDNNGIVEVASSINSHAATTNTTNTNTASFAAEPYNNNDDNNNNNNNNVPAIINTDIVEISCSNVSHQNNCRAAGPQSEETQSGPDLPIESSSSTSTQQGYTEKPANTTGAAITVVVMDTTQKEDPSIELVQRSLVQQQQQLPEQQQLPIACNNLVRKKEPSSDSGTRSYTTNGSCDSIDSINVSSSFRTRSSRQDDTSCSIEYECEHGACACAAAGADHFIGDAGTDHQSMSKQNNNNNGQHQPLHLWAKDRNRPGLLGGSGGGIQNSKNNSNNTIKDSNNIPSSSSSSGSPCESEPPVWVPRNYLDPYQHACQNKCHNPVFQNSSSSTMHSPSSRHTTYQQTLTPPPPLPPSNHDESDPPPCYEDALWLKRLNTRHVNDDDDYYRRGRHRSNENSPSRNKRTQRIIQLKETSL